MHRRELINAYTQAYSDYYPVAYAVIYGKVRNADTANDLCQELFTRFYEKFAEIDNYRRWIYSAIRFVLLEHYRSRNADSAEIESLVNDARMSFVNGFRDSRIMIEEALDDIGNFGDEKGKLLFDMIAFYNYTYDETASHMGLTKRQVRYQYGLIVDRLMDHFRKKGIKGLEDLL